MNARNLLKQTTCFLILTILPGNLVAYQMDNNPYRHFETLDKDGKFQLEWLVDWEESQVFFNVTVQTKGYVGFGLSRKGKMSGADIVIGGVLPNGQAYFSDRHAVGNQLPVEDPSQDWIPHIAWENNTHTFLSFSRPFETCDEDHDLPIHRDVIGLLWAFGEKDDDIEYHHQNRGVFYSYLLDPDLTPRSLEETKQFGLGRKRERFGDWKVWTISKTEIIPDKETTYLCGIYKAPGTGTGRKHVVGLRSILPTETERRHLHHYLLHRCIPPPGQDASNIFENLLGYQETCYILREPAGRIPTHYCTEVFHIWAVGQRVSWSEVINSLCKIKYRLEPNFFPEHVGLPFVPGEYFMLQVHYDNPSLIPGVQVRHALEIFYTDNPRQHDASPLFTGHFTPGSPSLLVPPNSLAHKIVGMCGAGCTRSMLPATGIRVFAAHLHSHLTGRSIRVIHIRNDKELPWISYDDNYNFDYQQIRLLKEERLILPGDSLVTRCIFDNTDKNGNATVGGFSTSQEMCSSTLYYYDRIPDRNWCHSEIRSEEYANFLQIYNTSRSNSRVENIVTAPSQNEGLLVSEVVSLNTDWTLAKRKQIQYYHRNLPQVTLCPSTIVDDEENKQDERIDILSGNWMSDLSTFPQRYDIFHKTNKRVTKVTALNSKRINKQEDVITDNRENLDPETEFVSTYSTNITPYERPNICASF